MLPAEERHDDAHELLGILRSILRWAPGTATANTAQASHNIRTPRIFNPPNAFPPVLVAVSTLIRVAEASKGVFCQPADRPLPQACQGQI